MISSTGEKGLVFITDDNPKIPNHIVPALLYNWDVTQDVFEKGSIDEAIINVLCVKAGFPLPYSIKLSSHETIVPSNALDWIQTFVDLLLNKKVSGHPIEWPLMLWVNERYWFFTQVHSMPVQSQQA